MTLTFIIIFILFIITVLIVRPSGIVYIKQLAVPLCCIVFILCLILLSGTAVKAAEKGLALWATIVVPSLFPFFAAAELLNATGFIRSSGILLEPLMRPLFNVPGCASFALAMGITSGYPVGAKITCDLKDNGLLTRVEAERLLAFTNNSGPLFIVGAVGTGMYGSSRIGIFLFICHLLACFTVGFLFRFYKSSHSTSSLQKRKIPYRKAFTKKLKEEHANGKINFGSILGDAVKNSVSTILIIGGFIVLFSVIIQLLTDTGLISVLVKIFTKLLSPFGFREEVIQGILSGIFEITTGSGLVSQASGIPLNMKLPAVSFIIGWAGISVHSQVFSITSKSDVPITPYLTGKFLQGIIAAIYTSIGIKLVGQEKLVSFPVLGTVSFDPASFFHILGKSLLFLFVILLFYIIISAIPQHKKRSPI